MVYRHKGSSKSIETKRSIEKTAAKLFALKGGCYSVTLEEIAGEVGVTGTTVFNYFGNRERLFLNVALLFWGSLVQRLGKELTAVRYDARSDPVNEMQVFFKTVDCFLKEDGRYFAVTGFLARSFMLAKDADGKTKEVWQTLQRAIEDFQTMGVLVIKRGGGRNVFRTDCPANVLWFLFWGGFCGFVEEFFRRLNHDDYSSFLGDFQFVKNILMEMLLAPGVKIT